MLRAAGIADLIIFDGRVPEPHELSALDILFVAGIGESESRDLCAAARAVGVLVNVEDVPKLCDFHVPAQVRRGDLLITVSTGGRSPGLSSVLREVLEDLFGTEWERRLDEVAKSRARWRSAGLASGAVAERTRELLAERHWLGGGGGE